MGPITLKISTNQQACSAGSVVQGYVAVEVLTKNNKESSADGLKLRLVGQTKTDLVNSANEESFSEANEFLVLELQLGSFGGKAASGVHSFPFSIMLPADSPPSLLGAAVATGCLSQEGKPGASCSIQYSFTAHLRRPGLLNSDAKASSILMVLGTPQQAGAAVPVLVEPVTQPLMSCCFFNAGSISLGFRMERSIAVRNEPIDLVVVIRNDSSSNVMALKIHLQQECRWSARGKHEKMTRVIASMVVPGSELGKMEGTPGLGSDRGQVVAPVEENPRDKLMQRLAAGSGVRTQLVVPGNCLLSLQTTNITVTHSVGVMLVTPDCMAAPCVWAPLSVVLLPTGPVSVALPGATSPVPPQTLPEMPRHVMPLQTLPDLPRQNVQQYSTAEPYGPAPTAPFPNSNPPQVTTYGSAQNVPYPHNNPPPGTSYGSAQNVPLYSHNNPLPGAATYDSAPRFVPYMPCPSQQPIPYATAVEMDAYGNVTPAL